jgi:hypothetical protein
VGGSDQQSPGHGHRRLDRVRPEIGTRTGPTYYGPGAHPWRHCEITGEPGDWGSSPFTGSRGPVQFAADRVTG